MFNQLGPVEIIVILLAALLLFGPNKLPELGRSIGRGIREFKQAFNDVGKSISLEEEKDAEEK
jgi:sec-independent protein translocase protein TatA